MKSSQQTTWEHNTDELHQCMNCAQTAQLGQEGVNNKTKSATQIETTARETCRRYNKGAI